jgi:hypothetical protein
VKRISYLAVATLLVAMTVLVPTALAQDLLPGDDDPMTPEPDAIAVSHEQLTQIAGQPPPSQGPTSEPLPQTGGPGFGGPAVVLPTAGVLLLSSGVLAYGVLRKVGERG